MTQILYCLNAADGACAGAFNGIESSLISKYVPDIVGLRTEEDFTKFYAMSPDEQGLYLLFCFEENQAEIQ